jgi:formylglycine-generating enzyme required for sulfatase activity
MKFIILVNMMLLFSTSAWADSCPVGMVLVDSFCIDKHEVTNAEYQANIGQGPYQGSKGHDRPNQPRVSVNWFEAKVYCEKLGKRLPTSKEWIKAAGIPLTDDCLKLPKKEAVIHKERASDICSMQENAYGLCDMWGNVWEWVSDLAKNGTDRVAYGGSVASCWADYYFDYKMTSPPKKANSYSVYFGIRCAQDVVK